MNKNMEEKKYKLLEDDSKIVYKDNNLYRIVALKDFSDVKAGDLGGYIHSEDNLSQSGDCWVYESGEVHDDSTVTDNAKVYGRIFNNCHISGNSSVSRRVVVARNSNISDNAVISGSAFIRGNVTISGNAQIGGNAIIEGDVKITDDAVVIGNPYIGGSAIIAGNAYIDNNGKISHNALIKSYDDLAVITNVGYNNSRRNTVITFFMCSDGIVRTESPYVYGTIDDFRAEANSNTDYSISKYAKEELLMIADLMELKFKNRKDMYNE